MIATHQGYTVDERTGCWIADERGPSGFGPYLAFFLARNGPVPEGLEVVHRCPNGPYGCVRPSHMDLVPEGDAVRRERLPPLAPVERDAFSNRIRDERLARRQTRREFSRELRVASSTLASWEQGRSAPSGDHARQIAEKLGWDGRPRRFVVTFVGQQVVTERSAGAAMRRVWDHLDSAEQDCKLAVYDIHALR